MSPLHALWFGLALSGLIVIRAGPGQDRDSAPRFTSNQVVNGKPYWYTDPSEKLETAWANGQLSDNPAVLATVQRVKRQFTGTIKESGRYADRLRAMAKQDPTDTKAVFMWAVAATLQAERTAQIGESYWRYGIGEDEGEKLAWMMAACKPYKGYAYVRYRYLVETRSFSAPKLMSLGRKLLEKDPKDELVGEAMVYQLCGIETPGNVDEALRLVTSLLARDPNRLVCVGLKASVFLSRVEVYGNRKEDVRQCLEWGQRYMAMAPRGSANAADESLLVKVMKAKLAKMGGE